MSLGSVSHVGFKKRTCRPVNFNGEWRRSHECLLDVDLYRERDDVTLSTVAFRSYPLWHLGP